jgi:hypothetical protein
MHVAIQKSHFYLQQETIKKKHGYIKKFNKAALFEVNWNTFSMTLFFHFHLQIF